jgi:hypothetical protein
MGRENIRDRVINKMRMNMNTNPMTGAIVKKSRAIIIKDRIRMSVN